MESSVIGIKTESKASMEAQIKRGMRIALVIKKILQSDEGGDIRPGENVLDATGEVRIKGEKKRVIYCIYWIYFVFYCVLLSFTAFFLSPLST